MNRFVLCAIMLICAFCSLSCEHEHQQKITVLAGEIKDHVTVSQNAIIRPVILDPSLQVEPGTLLSNPYPFARTVIFPIHSGPSGNTPCLMLVERLYEASKDTTHYRWALHMIESNLLSNYSSVRLKIDWNTQSLLLTPLASNRSFPLLDSETALLLQESFAEQFPIFLKKRSHYTDIVVNQIHIKHITYGEKIKNAAQEYWPISVSTEVLFSATLNGQNNKEAMSRIFFNQPGKAYYVATDQRWRCDLDLE